MVEELKKNIFKKKKKKIGVVGKRLKRGEEGKKSNDPRLSLVVFVGKDTKKKPEEP